MHYTGSVPITRRRWTAGNEKPEQCSGQTADEPRVFAGFRFSGVFV